MARGWGQHRKPLIPVLIVDPYSPFVRYYIQVRLGIGQESRLRRGLLHFVGWEMLCVVMLEAVEGAPYRKAIP